MTVAIESSGIVVDEMHPSIAWKALAADPKAVLIDVRSSPEWHFVGRPDLSEIDRKVLFIPWKVWPTMAVNLGFISDLEKQLAEEIPEHFFFLCRAGLRSVEAAQEFAHQMAQRGLKLHCTNVMYGFEGDKNQRGQRGEINGWKAEQLPWTQD